MCYLLVGQEGADLYADTQFKGLDILGITEINCWKSGGVTVFYHVYYRLHLKAEILVTQI